MVERTLAILLCAALVGCASVSTPTAGGLGDPGYSGFSLWSPGRADNSLLELRHAGKNPANPNCRGENVSPPLAWARVPAGTRSLVLLMDDQAGRAGLGVNHWVAYGISPERTGFTEGESLVNSPQFVAGRNTLGQQAYLGPCPPRGNAPQHYVFTLIATSLEPDSLAPGLDKATVLEALKGKTLGAASLATRYAH